jgi:lipid II:glycine glycyltransferase (peptidoglycan interpeptide bridge formation enzyme)
VIEFRPANARELEVWDDLTVHPSGGHVYQSRAWAEHRAKSGWDPQFLVGSDGSAVLALVRPWPLIGGSSAYLPRGPVPAGDVAAMAARLEGVAARLGSLGVDVVASDAEVPAETGYRAAIERLGFRPIDEIQPSRHRMSLPLGHGVDEASVLAGASKSTRQRIRKAEEHGSVIVRHDTAIALRDDVGEVFRVVGRRETKAGERDEAGEGFVRPDEPTEVALDRFYDLLLATGERRDFTFGPRESFVAWWVAAYRAGHLILLEARDRDGTVLAGLVVYRHGGRLSTVHSADDAAGRKEHPGALHLLRWRAIQLAIREGRAEMDLGGVDVHGAREKPTEGDPMYGLYQHKRGFGAEWVQMAGAHERVARPWRYAVGRATLALARRVRR